ncbi:MAG TPA: chemotaxis-specific protein-glutamate methyltransferase CheB [Opitutaceae bacterium]|nr:chemotaxis-specific protein-glutamate methyltransferase CheB [Opitutaceae bacterium]
MTPSLPTSRDSATPIPAATIKVPQLIRVVVVDDSAFVRKIVREMLARSPFLEVVGVARDGEEALQLVEELKPDVVTCDLTMPRVDGVAFVRRQMARRPLPILILSASPEDGGQVMEALAAGAVDFVQKPTALATDELLGIRERLVDKVKAAVRAPLANLAPLPLAHEPVNFKRQAGALRFDAIVLGVSTGGPQALRHLLPQLPANFPVPLLMVLHMPVGYTALFAEKLNELSAIAVSEAKDGEPLRAGAALLAPAGRHLLLRRDGAGRLVTQLSLQPIEKIHRPSVDVLFQSAAETLRERVLAVVMTGMGDDGKQGAAWIKAQGGTVLTEAEKSCIIYGMPRSVVEAGLSDEAVPLGDLARTLLQKL